MCDPPAAGGDGDSAIGFQADSATVKLVSYFVRGMIQFFRGEFTTDSYQWTLHQDDYIPCSVMDMKLDVNERRVLGVLMEKSMTQPEYYPMTINAIVAGCNQRSNRDPVMELDEVAVVAALDNLRRRGLVEQMLAGPGSRSDRFKHRIEATFGWGPRERAIMTELMLRGPQTTGELRGHCTRMAPFYSIEIVANVLGMLSECDPPAVTMMERDSGRAARYRHLWYSDDEVLGPVAKAAGAPASFVSSSVERQGPLPADGPAEATMTVAHLQQQIEDLHTEIVDLQKELVELRKRLDNAEQRLGL